MINKPHFSKFRTAEVLQFSYDNLAICTNHDPAKLSIAAQTTGLQTATAELDQVFKLEQKSKFSEQVENTDQLRDDCLTGIKLCAEAFSYHFEPVLRAAANNVLNSIELHGKAITRQNYEAETNILNDILNRWTSDTGLSKDIATLGLTAWSTEMKRLNDLFNTTFLSRIKETSEKPQVKTPEMRRRTIEAYRALTAHIEARTTLSVDGAYTPLVNELNALVYKYNILVDNRGNDDDTGTSNPPKTS